MFEFDRKVPNGKRAKLSLKEMDDFEAVIAQMSGNVAKMRQQCVSKLRENIEQILAGSRAALPPDAPSETATLNPRPTVIHRNVQHMPLLFVNGAVSYDDVEILKVWSGFLESKLPSYTPSAKAQTLAVRANVDLQVLIVFLMKQLDLLRQSKEIIVTTPATVNAPVAATGNAPVTASERENRIREFISLLQRYEDSIEGVIAKEWVVDRELEAAQTTAQAIKANIFLQIAEAKSRAVSAAIDMGRWIVGSFIAALLLLVVRDFMSAVIDTAANTGGMLDLMTPKDSDKTNEA